MASDERSLWESINARSVPGGSLHGSRAVVALADLAHASSLGGRLEELRGRTVLLATKDQLTAALAMIELDGVARRIVLCAPDLPAQHLPGVIRGAGADACVRDVHSASEAEIGLSVSVTVSPRLIPARYGAAAQRRHGMDPAHFRNHRGT